MSDIELDYKHWLIEQITKDNFYSVVEAYDYASKFMETPRYLQSLERWRELQLDVVLASNPPEQIKFPNV